MALVAGSYENFMGGQVSSVPVNELNPGQVALAENCYLSLRDKPGIAVKRKGYSKHWDESGTYTGPVKAIHNYLKNDGTEQLLFIVESGGNTEVRRRTGATTSALVHSFTGTGKRVSLFTSSTDFAILACEDNAAQKWDGTTASTINEPAAAQDGIMVLHDGRLWTRDATTLNKLHFSAVSDEDDFTTQDNAGDIQAKMPKIAAMATMGRAGLLVADEHALNVIEGDNFQTYRITEISNQVGCKSRASMVSFGNFVLFVSHDGVVAVSESGMEKISLPVEDIIDAWDETTLTNTKGYRFKEFYILTYDSNASGTNDKSIVFDTRFGIWVTHTNTIFSGGTTTNDQVTYVASDVDGQIYKWDDTQQDDGTDIEMTVTTKGWDFGRFFARKTLRRGYFQSNKPGVTTDLRVQPVVDGVDVGVEQNYDLNFGEGDLSFVDSGAGNVIQLRMYNCVASSVELRSVVMLCDMKPAAETI